MVNFLIYYRKFSETTTKKFLISRDFNKFNIMKSFKIVSGVKFNILPSMITS